MYSLLSSQESSGVFLQQNDRLSRPLILLPLHPPTDRLLHQHARCVEFIRPQFLHVGHLPGSEKDLGLTELVLVRILQMQSCKR